MKKRVYLVLLSTLALTGCSLLDPLNYVSFNNSSSSSSSSSSSEEYSTEPFDLGVELSITSIEFFDENGNIHVYYDNSINPFAFTGHKFSYLLINGEKAETLKYSEFLNSKGYFDTVSGNKAATNYEFNWVDKNGDYYVHGMCNNIIQYQEPEPIDPEEPDDGRIIYPEGYNAMIFQDEFTGTSVDETKWDYDLGNGSNGWGNGEGQYYTKKNATVKDGQLHITGKKERIDSFNYTSSRMVTRGKFFFKYGYIEAKISLPEVAGMWPAFWLLPESNIYGGWPKSGEIDIMEAKGRWNNSTSSALHFTDDKGNHTYTSHDYTFPNSGTFSSFHTYACEWKQDVINYYIDGVRHFTVRNTEWQTSSALDNENAPFDQNFHLILNLAIGGTFDGWTYPPDGFTSCDMVVEYVRVFK